MSALAQKLLDVDQFLTWSDAREGKWELHGGVPVAMSPEHARHGGVKAFAATALVNAIGRARAPCGVYVDSLMVRIRSDQAFRPDVLVVCPDPQPDVLAISNPVIVVEVLSPSTADNDHGIKREGYFSLPSVAQYLILDPDRRFAVHHARGAGGAIVKRMRRDGRLRLNPLGLEFAIAELFGYADRGS
jgi:Uma2 family endonuclease